MEFPAVSQSRKEFWSEPQYTRGGMLLFTVVFGFFGLHHLLLRSPQTALVMFIANIFLLGYPWIYDIVQLLPESWGGHGVETLNTYGMGHAFGPLGLAQGMWLPDSGDTQSSKDSPPNPWFFFLYVLLLPIGLLASLIAGDTWGAFGKFGYLTFLPLGWFLGFLSLLYDYYHVFLKPGDLLVFGAKRFFPWTLFGMSKDGQSPNITGKRNTPECPPGDNWFTGTLKFFIRLALPVLYFINPAFAMSLETGITSVGTGAGVIGDTAAALANAATKTTHAATGVVTTVLEDGTKIAKTVGSLAGELESVGSAKLTSLTQVGGGEKNPRTPLDYLAFGTIGAVIGGAFLLSAGRSYGSRHVAGDTPPNA